MEPKRRYRNGASRELYHWAHENRDKPTAAEEALWEALRQRRLGGLRFRRQHAHETFIFDFYCAEHRLIIEVDGGYHEESFQKEKDQERDAYLTACGFRLVRLTNAEVLETPHLALNKIKHILQTVPPSDGG